MNKVLYGLCLALVSSHVLHAEIPILVLQKYKPGKVVFCSGVYASVTFATALEAGFMRLYGIDRDEVLVRHNHEAMVDYLEYFRKAGVEYKVFHGEPSVDVLCHIIGIQEPILFVLSSCFPEPEGFSKNTILEELDQIAQHSLKNHVIMIEYVQYAGTPRFGNVSLEALRKKLLAINPHYKFSCEKGGHLMREENAVLVAYVVN